MLLEVTVHIRLAILAQDERGFLLFCQVFPERSCEGSLELLWLLGSLHCSPSWPKVGRDAAKQRVELRARK